MKKLLFFLIAVMMLSMSLISCRKAELGNDELWKAAMEDAVFAEDDEVEELVTLEHDSGGVIWNEAGDKVLLVTWHNYADDCQAGNSIGDFGDIWSTSLGEFKTWYKESCSDVKNWNLRFAQVLGVHEDEGYTRFTAFWVSPEKVCRPAYITDVTKQMSNDYSLVTGEWKEWFDGNILYSYFDSDYPWTRLGYTYDWGNLDGEYGLSEFLVRDPAATSIEFTCTTDEFVEYLAH